MRLLASQPVTGPATGRTTGQRGTSLPDAVLSLQGAAGNRAVCQLLARKPPLTDDKGYPRWRTTLVGHSQDAERIQQRTFKLFAPDELGQRRIEAGGTGPNEGLAVYSATGQRVPNGQYIFVMDNAGNFFIDLHVAEEIYHSSLSGGRWPAAAGEMKIQNGIVTIVNEASGHFAPDPGTADVAIRELSEQGFYTFQQTRPDRGFVEKEGKVPPYRVREEHLEQFARTASELRARQRRPQPAPSSAVTLPRRDPHGRGGGQGPPGFRGPPLGSGKFIE